MARPRSAHRPPAKRSASPTHGTARPTRQSRSQPPTPSPPLTQPPTPMDLQPERCCTCTNGSTCTTTGCGCIRALAACTNCRSTCCVNKTPITPTALQAALARNGTPAPTPPTPSPGISTQHFPVPPTAPHPDISDKPGYTPTAIDDKFDLVYGDHIHQNDGTHIHGDIPDDSLWQSYYNHLVSYPCTHFPLPRGLLGERFINTAASLLEGMVNNTNNSEQFLVFIMVILQRTPTIHGTRAIKTHLTQRLDAWDRQEYQMLVTETERSMKHFLSTRRRYTTPAQRNKRFNTLVQQGELRKAIQYITTIEPSRILAPSDTITGYTVQDILESKHPDPQPTSPATLHEYDNLPPLPPVCISDEVVLQVARRIRGSCGLDGTHAHELRSWLTQYHQASDRLRAALASLTQHMSNSLVPWPAIRALLSCRLIALDKQPGVRPIGIGHIWRRTIAKCFLAVTGPSATEVCGVDQLCAGLSAGIEGAVHAANQFWEAHCSDDDFGFLCIDAHNAFNEMNRVTMLWTIRHEWPQGALFSFNCYKHWIRLVVHDPSGELIIIYSKTGVTQGDPPAMLLYALGLLPLIRLLKAEFPDLRFHCWFADDGSTAGDISRMCEFFNQLARFGPRYGYHPQATKSILIVPSSRIPSATNTINQHGNPRFQICNGHRYLGGYIGDPTSCQDWLTTKTATWTAAVHSLTATCQDFPQSAYCALQKSLQQQWQFVQRVVPVDDTTKATFTPIEHSLDSFLRALFASEPPPREITSLPVKLSGLGIYDPTTTYSHSYQASQHICGDIIHSLISRSLDGPPPFKLRDHLITVSTQRMEFAKKGFAARKAALDAKLANPPPSYPDSRILERAQETGTWLSVIPTITTHSILSSLEFRDALHLRYGLPPPNLPATCDGCNAPFSIDHALTCHRGGLIILRHNELRDEIAALANSAFTPSAVSLEPPIHPSQPPPATAPPSPAAPPPTFSHERGDIMIRGFFDRAKDCVIDCSLMDLDCATYRSKTAKAALRSREVVKKNKYSRACAHYRRDFVPFVASADGLLGREADAFLQRLASQLALKWNRPYPPVCGYVRARIALSLVRASHLCIRGSRLSTTSLGFSLPPALQLDHAGGFHLLQHSA